MIKLVGINGFKRSGKGATAIILNEMSEGVVYEVGFADKLKIMGALALGFDRSPRDLIALMDEFKIDGAINVDHTEYGNRLFTGLTGREYLQNFGNHARNIFGENFWIDQVLPYPPLHDEDGVTHDARSATHLLEDFYGDIDVVAITDLRYPNEAERVRALGGVVWEVVRPGATSDGHASEQPLPPELVNWQILNDGTLEDLRDRVAEAIQETLA